MSGSRQGALESKPSPLAANMTVASGLAINMTLASRLAVNLTILGSNEKRIINI